MFDIRFIELSRLEFFKSFPRCPENQEETISLDQIDRDNSLLVFISHRWLRGDTESPHPDDAEGKKWQLCVSGIRKLKDTHAPLMNNCYVWIDYSCMNQDKLCLQRIETSKDLGQYISVMENCDAMFTPIIDDLKWSTNESSGDYEYLDDFSANLWNSIWKNGPEGYLDRAWCRLEMLYAAHIPVKCNSDRSERYTKFQAGLAHHCKLNRRPHYLYGINEQKSNRVGRIFPPLSRYYLNFCDPREGKLSKQSDLKYIKELWSQLDSDYIERNAKNDIVGYDGEKNSVGEKHGHGIERFSNGNMYDGEWKNGQFDGQGILSYVSGTVYTGQFEQGIKQGPGNYKFSNGATYDGGMKNNRFHGFGKWNRSNGIYYEGHFENGNFIPQTS